MSMMQMMMLAKSSASEPVTSFTHGGDSYASYERSIGNSYEKTFSAPSSAQAGDLLILTTFIDGNYEIETPPSGWTEIGNTTDDSDGYTSFPGGHSYYQIYNGSDTEWTVTWNGSDTSAGIVVAFRPDNPITTVTIEQFQGSYSASPLSDTISSVTDDPAVGGRIYMYFLTGRPTATFIQNPVPSFIDPASGSPITGWTHVDGDGALDGDDYMDYAYKLAAAGDAFVSTTITTNDGGQQSQHFFIVNAV